MTEGVYTIPVSEADLRLSPITPGVDRFVMPQPDLLLTPEKLRDPVEVFAIIMTSPHGHKADSAIQQLETTGNGVRVIPVELVGEIPEHEYHETIDGVQVPSSVIAAIKTLNVLQEMQPDLLANWVLSESERRKKLKMANGFGHMADRISLGEMPEIVIIGNDVQYLVPDSMHKLTQEDLDLIDVRPLEFLARTKERTESYNKQPEHVQGKPGAQLRRLITKLTPNTENGTIKLLTDVSDSYVVLQEDGRGRGLVVRNMYSLELGALSEVEAAIYAFGARGGYEALVDMYESEKRIGDLKLSRDEFHTQAEKLLVEMNEQFSNFYPDEPELLDRVRHEWLNGVSPKIPVVNEGVMIQSMLLRSKILQVNGSGIVVDGEFNPDFEEKRWLMEQTMLGVMPGRDEWIQAVRESSDWNVHVGFTNHIQKALDKLARDGRAEMQADVVDWQLVTMLNGRMVNDS
jgi:hypothetical protein